jgi:hypothetical protein
MPDQGHNTVLLRSEESDGAVSVIQNGVPANWPGPPSITTTSTRRSTSSRAS